MIDPSIILMAKKCSLFLIAFLVCLAAFVVLVKGDDRPWPRSQCTNGWVDRMTGKCPYAQPRKKPHARTETAARAI